MSKEKISGQTFVGTKISVFVITSFVNLGIFYLLCSNDRFVHGFYELQTNGKWVFSGPVSGRVYWIGLVQVFFSK